MANEQSIMPLVLNLLVEEQMAERKNARDPLKAVVAIAIVVVTLVVGAGVWFGIQADQKHAEVAELQQKCNKLTAAVTGGDIAILKGTRDFCGEIQKMNQCRAQFAPQLALIKEIVPETIQLTRIGINITAEMREVQQPTPGVADKGKPRRPAPPVSVEHLTLVLEGRAMSARPEVEVDDFLKAMRADPRLSSMTSQIQLRSIAPAPVMASANGGVPTAGSAAFVIECQYKELAK
jgi:hypothetical protein